MIRNANCLCGHNDENAKQYLLYCERFKRNSKIPKGKIEIANSEDRQDHGQQNEMKDKYRANNIERIQLLTEIDMLVSNSIPITTELLSFGNESLDFVQKCINRANGLLLDNHYIYLSFLYFDIKCICTFALSPNVRVSKIMLSH